MEIENGWRFFTADFSRPNVSGTVTFMRDGVNYTKWMNQSDEVKVADDCPEMFVIGRGDSFTEAYDSANKMAKNVKAIN